VEKFAFVFKFKNIPNMKSVLGKQSVEMEVTFSSETAPDFKLPTSAEVKKMWNYTSTPLYVFMP
jgi:hypothetical protein